MNNPETWKIIGAMLMPNVGGWVGGLITRSKIKSFYEPLKKPDWRPPNWAFGPVWTTLYTSMGYSSYLIYRDLGGFGGDARLPLTLFGSQLALNWIWTPIFFGAENIKLGLIDIVLLYANAVACGISFYNVNKVAGLIFVPYVAWLTIATALNYVIYRDNKEPKIKELKD